MAPEQFGSEQTDGRADIYSLGVAMVFMATGKTGRENLKTAYPYKELVPVIEKCVKKDRDQRFKSALQLKKRILRIRRKAARKTLIVAGVCAAAAAAFIVGLNAGRMRGYDSAVGDMMAAQAERDRISEQAAADAYDRGFGEGQARGFDNGVAYITYAPTERPGPFTQEELYEPITFNSWYLDMAVRNVLGKSQEDTIRRIEVINRVDEKLVFGTLILHPVFGDDLIKTHQGKGIVKYVTAGGSLTAANDLLVNARGDISSLEDIPSIYYLRGLTLISQSISDLSPLSGMELVKLNLSDNFVGNLLPLKDMVTLRYLDVCQNPLRDLAPISGLLSLESLDISQTQVTDLSPLAGMAKLQDLKLVYCDVSDIGVLAGLPDLRELDISHTAVTDLSPLLGRSGPLTVRCAGLPEEAVAKLRDAENITILWD
jgi:hypothetical protein